MDKSSVTLDRNKIYRIGKRGVKLAQISDSNKELTSWEVFKVNRKKSKLICDCWEGKLTVKFKSIKHAEIYKQAINKELKNLRRIK